MKITAITREIPASGIVTEGTINIPAEFRVGQPTVPGGPTVTEILYCRKGASNGEKGEFESYLVKTSSGENRIIPAVKVLDIAVVNEGKKAKPETNPEATVELPE